MRVIEPSGWKRPSGYAYGMMAEGRLLVTGGMVGWDETGRFHSDDLVEQARQALINTKAVLSEASAGPEHVVRMTWYILDKQEYLSKLSELGRAYRDVMGRHYPAMAMVQVSALMEDRARVEIETTAVLPNGKARSVFKRSRQTDSGVGDSPQRSPKDAARSKQALRAWLQMMKTTKLLERQVGRLFAQRHNTTLSRFDVLANLDRSPDQTSSISNLSQMLLASRGNITRLLDRMEKDGLICRREDPTDRRVSGVQMTEFGQELFSRLAPDHEAWVDQVFSALGEEGKQQLVRLLEDLREKLENSQDF